MRRVDIEDLGWRRDSFHTNDLGSTECDAVQPGDDAGHDVLADGVPAADGVAGDWQSYAFHDAAERPPSTMCSTCVQRGSAGPLPQQHTRQQQS